MNKLNIGKIGINDGMEYKVIARDEDSGFVIIGRGHGKNYNWNYEVHRIRVSSTGNDEILAAAAAFGVHAWGYSSLDSLKSKWKQFSNVVDE